MADGVGAYFEDHKESRDLGRPNKCTNLNSDTPRRNSEGIVAIRSADFAKAGAFSSFICHVPSIAGRNVLCALAADHPAGVKVALTPVVAELIDRVVTLTGTKLVC